MSDDDRKPMTPNQLVAFNLRRARELRGWTQEEAAERLEPYLGIRWSKGTFSAAETSAKGGRVRLFNADEIAALSLAFDLPLTWWFLPPRRAAGSVVLPGPQVEGVDDAERLLKLLLDDEGDLTAGRVQEALASLAAAGHTSLSRRHFAMPDLLETVAGLALATRYEQPAEDLRHLAAQLPRLAAQLGPLAAELERWADAFEGMLRDAARIADIARPMAETMAADEGARPSMEEMRQVVEEILSRPPDRPAKREQQA